MLNESLSTKLLSITMLKKIKQKKNIPAGLLVRLGEAEVDFIGMYTPGALYHLDSPFKLSTWFDRIVCL